MFAPMRGLFVHLVALSLCIHEIIGQPGNVEIANAPDPFVLGQVRTINSTELNETRTLNIYLPDGYSPDSVRTYPVIYLLDGSANEDFVHIVGIVQFLTMIGAMPQSIVVGIANVDRKRDFTFPTTIEEDKKEFPTAGGSAHFIAFLENELKPFIQQKYKTNGNNTIIGQSFGGLLATEILLKNPGMFNTYMIVSPSLWWDNESLLNAVPDMLSKLPEQPIRVHLSLGSEGPRMEADAEKLAEALKSKQGENPEVMFMPLPGENHLTILHNSIYIGFETLYAQE